MKSSRRRVRLLCGTAAVALLGVGVVGVGPARAASQGSAAAPSSPSVVSPVGIYHYFDGGIIPDAATTLNINANGTFNLLYSTITDNGVWLVQGRTIAMTVTSSQDGSSGCLLLGTIKRKGINSVANQGPIDCQAQFNKSGTWYAPIPKHPR